MASQQPTASSQQPAANLSNRTFFLFLFFSIFTFSSVQAQIYWSNFSGMTIGRADADGSNLNNTFITTTGNTAGAIADANFVYFANGNNIGRANLDGTGVNSNFITGGNSVSAPVIDNTNGKLLWANFGANTIGQANLDGTGVDQSFITGAGLGTNSVYVDHINSMIYYTAQNSATVGRANLDGTGNNSSLITNSGGFNQFSQVAIDYTNNKILYTRRISGEIGRANLDGTGVNESFITGLGSPSGISIDNTNNKIYILEQTGGAITQRDLDGSNVTPFLTTNGSARLSPDFVFAGAVAAPLVPTLSEWGLILLALFILTVGMLYATAPKMAMANGQTINSPINFRQLPFDKGLYFRILPMVALAVLVIFSVAILGFGYELTNADPFFAPVAVVLVSYLVLLLKMEK